MLLKVGCLKIRLPEARISKYRLIKVSRRKLVYKDGQVWFPPHQQQNDGLLADPPSVDTSSGMRESYNTEEISLCPGVCSSTVHSEKEES